MPTEYANAAIAERPVVQDVVPILVRRPPPPPSPIISFDKEDERVLIGRGIVVAIVIAIPVWMLVGVITFMLL